VDIEVESCRQNLELKILMKAKKGLSHQFEAGYKWYGSMPLNQELCRWRFTKLNKLRQFIIAKK
jgi:hypothetical protein